MITRAILDHGHDALLPDVQEPGKSLIVIRQSNEINGPNVWSRTPIAQLAIGFGAGNFHHRYHPVLIGIQLSAAIATLPDHSNPEFRREQSLAIEPGSSGLAWAIAGTAIELQRCAGEEVSFSWVQETSDPDIYTIVIEQQHAGIGIEAAMLAVRLLNSLISGTKFDLENEFSRGIAAMAANQRPNRSSVAAVAAARRRGIAVQNVGTARRLFMLGNGTYRRPITNGIATANAHVSAKIARNKLLANHLLREAGLPVAECVPVTNRAQAIAAAERIGYPVVLKPPDLDAGRGVFVDLESEAQMREFYPLCAAATRSRTILVESYIPGTEYRVAVVDRKVVAVAERVPAHVVGDGLHSIEALIEITNSDPRRGAGHGNTLTTIQVNEDTHDLLRRQHFTLQSVPAERQIVWLKRTGNLTTGGTTIDRTDDIHPDNERVVVQAAMVVGLNMTALDFKLPEIGQSVHQTGGAIIEVNGQPNLRGHTSPSEGQPRDVHACIIDMLFPPGQPFQAPIIAVAGGEDATPICQLTAQIISTAGLSVGLATREGLVIDGTAMRGVESRGPSGVRTLLNNPAVEIAVVEVEPLSIIDHGLGFDYCDVAVITLLSGLTTPFQQPVETVLTTLVNSSGTLVLNADDPATAVIADQEAGAALLYSTDETNQRVLRHVDNGGSAVVLRKNPTGDAIAHFNTETDHVLLQINPAPSIADSSITLQQVIAAVAAAAAQNISPSTIQTAWQTYQNARRIDG